MQKVTINYFIFQRFVAAQAIVQPTIGLLPMPRNPIISPCAGTDDKPRAEQIHLFCRGAKEEKPVGLN